MKRTPHLHNLRLIHLLTFASVIGLQINVLSTSAATAAPAAATATNFQFDALNTTRTTSTSQAATATAAAAAMAAAAAVAAAASSVYSSSAILPTSTTSAIYGSKTSLIMSSTLGRGSTATVGSGSSVMADGSSTASPTLKSFKNTSKFPLELTFSNNHWASSDTLNFGASATSTSSSTAEVERPRTFRNKHHHEHHWGPFFEEPLSASATGDNLVSTAHLFTEAVLNCRVGMLKDKTVMWVRRTTEKVSLLTVGNVTYSGDPRIRVKFQYPNNWRLLINPTHREDAGVYMCQVSTHPPRVFTTNLTILEPPLRLIDDQEREVGDRYYKSGSTIDLQCQVSKSFILKEKVNILKSIQPLSPNQTKLNAQKSNTANHLGYNEAILGRNLTAKQGQLPEKQFNNFIFWAKDDDSLPASAMKRSSATEKWLTSRITIPDAKLTDSGNYSCSIGKLFIVIVQVQVLTGELPAAVQHNCALAVHRSERPLGYWCWICFVVACTVISRNISHSFQIGSEMPLTLK